MFSHFIIFLKRFFCIQESNNIIDVYWDGVKWYNPYKNEHDIHEHAEIKVKLKCKDCRRVLVKSEKVVRYKKTKKILRIGNKDFLLR
jgi:hypothetical protein